MNLKIKSLFEALKKLRLLNLSSNKFSNKSKRQAANDNNNNNNGDEDDDEDESSPERIEIDEIDEDTQMCDEIATTNNSPAKHPFADWPANMHLTTLILNSCYLDLALVESLLDRVPNLAELHLASNDYSAITFSAGFRKPSVKVLYFNNNQLRSWLDVCALGVCFPSLETLVISENHIERFVHDTKNSEDENFDPFVVFKHLSVLIANKLKINDWSSIDYLRKFPSLRHVRIQNIPLLESLNDDEKYFVLVGHLDESIHSLNGSEITSDHKVLTISFVIFFLVWLSR